ncbi:predicted protein [Naegleria gruberi]|uniref:Predicted protein n=1 Tax=Naegleria gruberi TaxID=5762 RepID=D2VRP5_NAEGR|nr:uncharacterized protein NAEGRDRAFT_71658 [Naegleria gruberi]EFC40498.1 predicted protein [Naegleria gruberi]|eukprot:XP_002673242.1 predicted protein [Naegleria gruberi strain NEG-M]
MDREEKDVHSSDFSVDSNTSQEEYNRVMSVQTTDPQSSLQQQERRNEFQKYETIQWSAETNQPKTMNQHDLNQHQTGETHQQHVTNVKPSETSSNRRVSIIDETNRTRDKISKRKRKKSTRLRKPLQNDQLLKNYFEMDRVSSNEVTTFKIIPSETTSQDSSHDQQSCNTSASSESFIKKETFQVYSKLSESSEDSSRKSITPPQQQQVLPQSVQSSQNTTSAHFQNSSLTLQELMNSEIMHNFTQHSNNFSLSNTQPIPSDIPPYPPLTHEDPNPEPSLNNSQYSIHNNETLNEMDNSSFLSGLSPFTSENLDLLQILMQFTDNSDQPTTISKNNEQK